MYFDYEWLINTCICTYNSDSVLGKAGKKNVRKSASEAPKFSKPENRGPISVPARKSGKGPGKSSAKSNGKAPKANPPKAPKQTKDPLHKVTKGRVKKKNKKTKSQPNHMKNNIGKSSLKQGGWTKLKLSAKFI